LTEGYESCRFDAYQDQGGVWTIGYGHTGPDVHSGLCITQEQAEALLAQDVSKSAECVNELVTVALNQDEFDSLVDFVFNIGTSAFRASTMLIDLNKGDFAGAAQQFQRWDHAGGKVVAALLQRRNVEAALFESGEGTPTTQAQTTVA
jgi:lysozyme